MWTYKSSTVNTVEDIPEDTFGFVYQVTHVPTGRKYIGKKQLVFNKTLPPLKGKKRKRKVVKESDWKTYYGSNEGIKLLIKEGKQEEFTREILQYVATKKLLTYYELKWMMIKGVIEPDSGYINDNISGKFYRRDFIIKKDAEE